MGKPLILEIAGQNLVIDPEAITLKNVKDLANGLSDARNKYNPMTKHPMLEGEKWDDYEARVKKEITETSTRKVGETEDEFIRRIMSPSLDNQSFLFDQCHLIAKIFGQEQKVTESTFDTVPYVKARDFVNQLFMMVDLD